MQEFEEVYQQYFGQVYGFLFRMTGSTHIAEELTQETFLRALLNKATYREQGYMLTWLCTIAKNLWLNECRKHRYQAELDTELPDPGPGPEAALIQREHHKALRKAVLELPEDQWDVVILHIYAGLSLREISAQKEKSESWGKVTFYRAKQALTRKLGGSL